MAKKDLKSMHASLSWNTKMLVLLAFILVLTSMLFNHNSTTYLFPMLLAIMAIILANNFITFGGKTQNIWLVFQLIILIGIFLFHYYLSYDSNFFGKKIFLNDSF